MTTILDNDNKTGKTTIDLENDSYSKKRQSHYENDRDDEATSNIEKRHQIMENDIRSVEPFL